MARELKLMGRRGRRDAPQPGPDQPGETGATPGETGATPGETGPSTGTPETGVRVAFDPAVAYRAVLLALSLVAGALLFEKVVDLAVIVVVAVVLALPLGATASLLARWHVPRPIGVLLAFLGLCGLVALLLALLVPTFVHQVQGFAGALPGTTTRLEHDINTAFGLHRGTTSSAVSRFVHQYTQHPTKLLGPLSSVGESVATAVAALVVILISAIYMAINPQPLVNGVLRLFSAPNRPRAAETLQRIRDAWLGWLRSVAIEMVILGPLLYLGLRIIGLPFAAGFAILSALLTVIPDYGPVISAALPIAFGFTHSVQQGLLVTVLYVLVYTFERRLTLRLNKSHAVSIHPAVIAVGVLVATSLFGIVALFVSVPLISLTQILVDELWIKPHGSAAISLAPPGDPETEEEGTETPQVAVSSSRRGEQAVYGAILLGAFLVIAGLLVKQLVTLLLAVLLTLIISLPLAWCARRLERFGVPRSLGALLGLLAALAAAAGGLALLLPPLVRQGGRLITRAPSLLHTAELKVSSVTGQKPGKVATDLQKDLTSLLKDPGHLLGPIASIGLGVATAIAGAIIVLVTAYFMAARPDPLVNGLLSLFPARRRSAARETVQRIRDVWVGWLRGVAVSMSLVGALLYIALGPIVGLPFALVFAVFSGLAEVVPYLGALLSGIPPVLLALTISPGMAIEVLIIYIAIHQIEANFISPLVMSRAVHLHPAVIAIGVVAVGEIFGLLGLAVALPLLTLADILIDVLWVGPRAAGSPAGTLTSAAR